MTEHPIVLPDYLTPPRKRGPKRLRMIVVTLVSLFVVATLVAAYLWVEYLTYTQAAEDSLREGRIVVGAHTDLHDVSDPLPADISEEDYAAFWAEPALNTPDTLALLDLINEGWEAGLQENMEYTYSRVADISDADKRANAHAAVDKVAEFLSHGTVQAAKRVVYEDLAQLSRETCHRSDLVHVMYADDGHPIRNWITTDPQVLSLQAIGDQEAEATALVGKVYPDAFEAALPHFCKFPPPPESSHSGDMELLDSTTHEANLLLNPVRTRPNSEGQLLEDDYEAFWNSPVMSSPEVQAYLDRIGEEAVSNYRDQAAYIQDNIDQIKDPAVREHAQQYLEWVLDEAARDNGRRLAVGKVYEDLEAYWKATCTDEPDGWLHSSRIKRNIWNSRLEPDFSPDYMDSARSIGNEWSEATYDLAMEFYPEAYAAGVDYYCT
ncbi:hypothetical protein NNX28_16415 [Arthrobacter sp. zg-Y859]|uniref:Uncharacterized protein n=1 Tax=Arthrobacter jinronghuae TaxID=2964609 RepID=A0ABT1NWM2_9MICC|nr:hypothetical protein [Arthrobacter jinronghuae]MCQ1951507.1 hypothetical protein [Arthrobacter jinronghuae]UWX78855.1 hypothetical protein N2K98_01145 [Arthrobacter jinronghuae]